MSTRCEQELCHNWTGQGCVCEVMDVEPIVTCQTCGEHTSAGIDLWGRCPECIEVEEEEQADTFDEECEVTE